MPSKATLDGWVDRHGKWVVGMLLAIMSAWYGLKAQVATKAEKSEVDSIRSVIENIDANTRHTHEDMQALTQAYCRDRRTELGCAVHTLPR